MKRTVLLVALAVLSTSVFADQWVSPYTKRNGTSVDGYWRSDRNNTPTDNYSYKGNTNPYTGQRGYNSGYSTGSSRGFSSLPDPRENPQGYVDQIWNNR